MIDFAALPVFTTLIAQGSFSKAADHLGISKSAVSKRISALEQQLGVKLLHRSTRSFSLTEAGQLYYQHAVEAVSSANRAESLAMAMQDKPSGLLKVSAPWSIGRRYLARIFPQFLKAYPDIELVVSLTDTTASPIADGVDVALQAGTLSDSNLIARRLMTMKSVLCAAPEYLKNAGTPECPTELIGHNCIISSHHSTQGEWTFINEGEEEKIKVSGNYQVNNSEALHEAILQGIGIGRLPAYVACNDIAENRLERVLPTYQLPHKDLYAVYPNRQFLPLKVKVFVDFLTERLSVDQLTWQG